MSPAAPEDDVATAAEHALGLLPEAEAAAFEARLRDEPSLRALVAEWEEDLAALADEVPAEAPPARIRRALLRRLFPGRRRRWAWLGGLGGLAAAAAIALAVLVGAGALRRAAPRAAGDRRRGRQDRRRGARRSPDPHDLDRGRRCDASARARVSSSG